MTLTKNTEKLRQEVAAHVAADSIAQGICWDEKNKRGGFIGCLAKSDDPPINEATYGLPVMVQHIAGNIFEALLADEAKAFFAALPDAVSCDGKDLTKVSWQFLAAELRSLPRQPAEIQTVIDPVIAGMDLLASGQEWPEIDVAARAAAAAARTAEATAAEAAAAAAAWTAWAAVDAEAAAGAAAWAAAAAARTAEATAAEAAAAARLRQRDLLLRLISEAPVWRRAMSELSPAAQAVLDAVCATTEPDCSTEYLIAAALRAATDLVVPEPNNLDKEIFSIAAMRVRWAIRDQFLAIATELENHQ